MLCNENTLLKKPHKQQQLVRDIIELTYVSFKKQHYDNGFIASPQLENNVHKY